MNKVRTSAGLDSGCIFVILFQLCKRMLLPHLTNYGIVKGRKIGLEEVGPGYVWLSQV